MPQDRARIPGAPDPARIWVGPDPGLIWGDTARIHGPDRARVRGGKILFSCLLAWMFGSGPVPARIDFLEGSGGRQPRTGGGLERRQPPPGGGLERRQPPRIRRRGLGGGPGDLSCFGPVDIDTLCYAIVLPGHKSAFRAGFWPDCCRENTEI